MRALNTELTLIHMYIQSANIHIFDPMSPDRSIEYIYRHSDGEGRPRSDVLSYVDLQLDVLVGAPRHGSSCRHWISLTGVDDSFVTKPKLSATGRSFKARETRLKSVEKSRAIAFWNRYIKISATCIGYGYIQRR